MAARKGPPRCTFSVGHAAEDRKRADKLEQELKRLGAKHSALVVEKGPRCEHPTPGPDEVTVRRETRIGLLQRDLNEALHENTELRTLLTQKQYDTAVKRGIIQ